MIVNRKNAIHIALSVLTLGVLTFVGVSFALQAKPVLASLHNDVRDHHGSQLLNPFRSRAPERAADDFLTRLDGDCSAVLTNLGEEAKRKQWVCDSEQKYPMKGWRLEAIGQDGTRMLLRYGVSRDSGDRMVKDPFWIWVSKKDDQAYHVTGYDLWY